MRGSVLQNNNRLVSVILATTAPRVRGLLGAVLRRSFNDFTPAKAGIGNEDQ